MKQSDMKIKKTSRGVLASFSLIGLTILSAFILSKVTLSARAVDNYVEEAYVDTVTITVPASCNIAGYIDTENNKQHNATISNGLYQADIGETVVSVTCNDNLGYSVYAIGYGEDTEGTTTMKGASTNTTIPTGTVTDASVSNWAMKLTAVSGTFTPTILSDTNGSYSSYHVVPATATKVVTFTNSINLSSTSQFKTTYAVGVSDSQVADTYTGKVKYTLVHPNFANADGTVSYLYDTIASMSKGNFDMSTINDTLTTPTSSDPTQDTSNSGVYKYTGNHSDGANTKDIYFYRGILDSSFSNATPFGSTGDGAYYPNYVKLTTTVGNTTTNTCWRIFRTTGSGGVKMLYNGTWDTTNNTCARADANYNSSVYYNRASDYASTSCNADNAYCGTGGFATYVGYNYNSTYAYNNTSYTTAINNTELFNNETASNIRTQTENWYSSKIGTANNSLFESNAGYCNDRSTYGSNSASATETTTTVPYAISGSAVYFGAYHRLYTTNASPTLECPNTSGNDLLNGTTGKSYPVALITADELALAGNGYSGKEAYNQSSFLATGSPFWSLSPFFRYSGGYPRVFSVVLTGNLGYDFAYGSYGLRPAISLAPGTLIMSGSGTATDPWVVQ